MKDKSSSTPDVSGSLPCKKKRTREKDIVENKQVSEKNQGELSPKEIEETATAKLLEYLKECASKKQSALTEQLGKELDRTYLQDDHEREKLSQYAEHVMSEIYTDFFTIGHTHDGKTNVVIRATTDRDKEGLTEALRRFFTSEDFPIV